MTWNLGVILNGISVAINGPLIFFGGVPVLSACCLGVNALCLGLLFGIGRR